MSSPVGINPFDDDSCSVAGVRVGYAYRNPFGDDSESGGNDCKSAPSAYNPFDSDNDSEPGIGLSETLSPKELGVDSEQNSQPDSLLHQHPYPIAKSVSSSNSERLDDRERTLTNNEDDCNSHRTSHSQSDRNSLTGDELERAIVDNEDMECKKLPSINNSFETSSDIDIIDDVVNKRSPNSTDDSEDESTVSDTDKIDDVISTNDNDFSITKNDTYYEASSSSKDISSVDEESQILHQTASQNNDGSQTGDEQLGNSKINEATSEYDRDDKHCSQIFQNNFDAEEQLETRKTQSYGREEKETSPLFEETVEKTYWDEDEIREAVASFDLKCAQDVLESKVDVEDQRTFSREYEVKRSSKRRKKVKHRYCKAFVMVTAVWAMMIILVSITLGIDWIGVKIEKTESESLCTLCGENSGIDFNFSAVPLRPTRQPSTQLSPIPLVNVTTIKSPPDNIAELCAPSIFLDHGREEMEQLASSCASACLPAACCVSENDRARQSIIALLKSQGMGVQADTLFSTIESCNTGSNVALCDTYNNFCSTLYDIDYALDVMSKNLHQECSEGDDDNSIAMAFSRRHNSTRRSMNCEQVCLPLSCCYRGSVESTSAAEIKRRRQHNDNVVNFERITMEANETKHDRCDSFIAPEGSLNARICKGYSSFCDSRGSVPTSAPTHRYFNHSYFPPSLSPLVLDGSYEPSQSKSPSLLEHPSIHPTGILNDTIYPSYYNSSINTTQPSTQTTVIPSRFISKPSSTPTISLKPSSFFTATSTPSLEPTQQYIRIGSSNEPTMKNKNQTELLSQPINTSSANN